VTGPSWPLVPVPPPPALPPETVRERLAASQVWDALGFTPADAEELARWRAAVSAADIRRIAAASAKVLALPGQRLGPAAKSFFDGLPDRPGQPPGLLPMIALGVCAPEVVEFGRAQGFATETAGSGLRDLGQQARVHRLATGSFGLFTQWWLTLAWGGSLWWFGRLQFNLMRYEGEYWLSVHIPQTGPLAGVRDSFDRAREFAARHLGEFAIAGFHLDSWLLDPNLAAGLGPESNIATFAGRWELQPAPREASDDALFFTFGDRAATDYAALPRRTRLERVVAERLEGGGAWHSPTGLIRWGAPAAVRAPR